MLKSFILASLVLTSVNVLARGGDYKGNGGAVIHCPNKLVPYEVVDLYEMRAAHGLPIKFAAGSTYTEILENMFQRIARLNPSRAQMYRGFLQSFMTESSMIENADLTILPGEDGWGPIEKDCSREQAIVQFITPNLAGKRYFVAKDLWNELNEQNKAALVLHELIYREGLQPQTQFANSIGVRYLNGVYHSEIFETLSLAKYFETLDKVGFLTADAQGYPVLLGTPVNKSNPRALPYAFWDQDHLAFATLAPDATLHLMMNQRKDIDCTLSPGQAGHNIKFYANGNVKSVALNCTNKVYVDMPTRLKSVQGTVVADAFQWTEAGVLQWIYAGFDGNELAGALRYKGPDFNFVRDLNSKSGGVSLGFNTDGEVDLVCMSSDYPNYQTSWVTLSGKRVTIKEIGNGPMVSFDKNRVPRVSSYSCY
jgi:hypothetical protein